MAANSGIDILSLDFDTIKANLKTFLRNQGAFKDLDYEGSNLNVLIDLLAYNSFYNNFYTNMISSEMFIDSAITRDAIISHAKQLNYNPRSARSAVAYLDVTVTPDDSPSTITIPKHYPITSSVDGSTYTFRTESAHVIKPDALGDYTAANIAFYEGRQISEYFTVNANTSQKFLLNNINIDTRSIEITIRESNTVSTNTVWRKAISLFGEGATSNIYFVTPAPSEKWEIQFGNNIVGRRPIAGNIVEAHYRVASKAVANKASSFTTTTSVDGYGNITLQTNVAASGGANIESIESIRVAAPRTLQVQDRAVTPNDYKILIQNEFPEVQSISVYGGEEVSPPKYGRVIMSVDLTDADGIPDSKKNEMISFLKQRTPVAINVDIVDPEFTYLQVASTVKYNVNVSRESPAQIISDVSNAMLSFAKTNINTFENPLRTSQLISTIDLADTSIISNDTTITPFKKIIPTISTAYSFTSNFYNALQIDGHIDANTVIATHRPAVESTSFTYKDVSSYLVDDALGTLCVVTNANGVYQILETNIGTVNYETGQIDVEGLVVDSFQGDSIKLKVRVANTDIQASQNTILQLNGEDITINVIQERI